MALDGLKPFKDGELNSGGPAFPNTFSVDAHGRCVGIHDSTAHIESVAGMTLRDWFAGQALQTIPLQETIEHGRGAGFSATDVGQHIAISCYKIADAMIAARG